MAHSYRTLYKLLCHYVSNVPAVTNANVLQMSVIDSAIGTGNVEASNSQVVKRQLMVKSAVC